MTDDEQLQDAIDKKLKPADSLDAKLYRSIFDALEKEPYELPYGFADQVVRRLETSKQNLSRDYLWMGLGIFLLAIAAGVTAFIVHFKINFGAFKFISGYGGLIIFAIFFIMALQWVDRFIIQKKLMH